MRDAEKLINAVRERQFLYDQSLQRYKHTGTKQKQWMEVAKIVYGRDDKITVNKVKMQWKSLRDAFVKQQRKRQSSEHTGRPYIYEDDLKFLLPHILMKEHDDQLPTIDDAYVPKYIIKTEDTISLNASVSSDSQAEIEQESIHVNDEFIETPGEQKDIIWNQKEMHSVDAFFHGIAQTVKQLKPATIARLKKAVANIVMDAEIEELENATR